MRLAGPALLLVCAAAAAGENWKLHAESQGIQYFVDQGSIHADGQRVTLREKRVDAKPMQVYLDAGLAPVSASGMITLYELDCAARTAWPKKSQYLLAGGRVADAPLHMDAPIGGPLVADVLERGCRYLETTKGRT